MMVVNEPVPSPRTRQIIGRDKEIKAIRQAIAEAQSRVLMFVGPGGIGKTRLLEEVGSILAQLDKLT